MSAGTVFAGVIAFLLGLVGLLELLGSVVLPVDLAIVSAFLTRPGAFLLFGAITLVGLGLIIGGLVTLGERESTTTEVRREVIVMQPAIAPAAPVPATLLPIASTAVYAGLSDLEISILRLLSQGKSEDHIAHATGVARAIVDEKVAKLYSEGYVTDRHALTEKGFDALRAADERLYVNPVR